MEIPTVCSESPQRYSQIRLTYIKRTMMIQRKVQPTAKDKLQAPTYRYGHHKV